MAEVVFLPTTRLELADAVGGGFFAFDCVEEIAGSDEVKLSEHPLEDGATTTDHYQLQPATLTLQGVTTATPLAIDNPEPERVKAAFARLLAILRSGEPVTIATQLRTWANMVLIKVDQTTNVANGNALTASLSFKEVRFAVAEFVVVPASILAKRKASGASKKDKGLQASAGAGAGAGGATSTTAAQEALRAGDDAEGPPAAASDLYGIFGP